MTPAKPSSTNSQWRGLTRSPSSGTAIAAAINGEVWASTTEVASGSTLNAATNSPLAKIIATPRARLIAAGEDRPQGNGHLGAAPASRVSPVSTSAMIRTPSCGQEKRCRRGRSWRRSNRMLT